MKIVVGIDASRNRSGGAKTHLIGILKGADPMVYGIHKVHVWSYESLINALPDYTWLVKHTPSALEKSLLHQVWWQYRFLPHEAYEIGCSVLFNTDAGSICPFVPGVTMSRDMLSYEPGEMKRLGLSTARLRLLLLRYIQSRSLKKANGVIFLSNYAVFVIQKKIGPLKHFTVIPHGVGEEFRQSSLGRIWPNGTQSKVRCLYVSGTAMYKHQWNVVKAIGHIRAKGYNVCLLLVGGGNGHAQRLLDQEVSRIDPKGEFIEQKAFQNHDKIPGFLARADVFIFASSCENLPNTLLEAMASGLPIACSNRGPMPEVLADGGVYFNPEDPDTIVYAVEQIIKNSTLRETIAQRAKDLSEQYSWSRCADDTWRFIVETYKKSNHE